MNANNPTVADLLRRYASALAVEGVDRFKVKAYRRAAETLEATGDSVAELVTSGGDLTLLPGIGKAISSKIEDIVRTGKLPQLERALAHMPAELAELATKPHLDSKQVLRIYKKLGISSLRELQAKQRAGIIRDVFGARLDYHIRAGLSDRPRTLLWAAEETAQQIAKFLAALPGVQQVAQAGSLRRKQDTIGDLNFLVSGSSTSAIFQEFAKFPAVQTFTPGGKRRMNFKLSSGRCISLTGTSSDNLGLALILHTGSVAHVAALKKRARNLQCPLTAKALGDDARTEKGVYARLGLRYIEPELREDRGEVQAAADGKLPRLLDVKQLRGDLHMHTTASDGTNTLAEMASAAIARGYEYIAITDHSQSLKITNGLSEKRLFAQIRAIDKLNARLKDLVILKSAEVDILEDGTLDYSKATLKELDLTICSIHSRFNLGKRQQTERIMRAMENPHFNILGHATGRLLLRREGYEVDMERIIAHAADRGCFFEVNSNPNRLDLSDEHAKMAKEAGLKLAINTDAHSIEELNFISAGVSQARRGWLTPTDVLNTLPLEKLKRQLRRH